MIKAYAKHDFFRDAIDIKVGETNPQGEIARIFTWMGEVQTVTEPGLVEADRDSGILLREDIARAIYEALADHFGHNGHDVRALRRDYDAERKRVDTFIAHLTQGGAS